MPDLFTHTATGWIIGDTFKNKIKTASFIFGSILPDIITRTIYIPFPKTYPYVCLIHNPIPVFIIILLLSEILNKKIKKDFIVWTTSGMLTHIFMDLYQTILGGQMLLFPFYNKLFQVSLIDQRIYFLYGIVVFIIVLSIKLLYIKKTKKIQHN